MQIMGREQQERVDKDMREGMDTIVVQNMVEEGEEEQGQ